MVLRNFACLGLLIAVCCAWPTSSAHAQAWLSDRGRTEGEGFKVGNLELHPGIGVEGGWQNNVFNSDPGNNVEPSALLRVSPHLMLSTRRARAAESDAGAGTQQGGRVSFRGGVSGSLYHYFEAYERTDMGIGADMKLTINEGKPFSVIIDEEFKREIRPFSQPSFSSPMLPAQPTNGNAPNYGRDQNTVGARFQLATPGDLLKGSLGYSFGFDMYEDDLFDTNNSMTHTVSEQLSWTFLPKTALFQMLDVAFQSYASGAGNSVSTLNDNKRVSTEMGLNGALSPAWGLTLAAGYGAGFYDNNVDYESITLRTQVRWKISEAVKSSLGYQRAFQSTFQGNFARTDAIRAEVNVVMGGVFYLQPSVGVNFVDFGPTSQDGTQGARNDIYLDATLSGEYRVIDWLAITAEVAYMQNFSEYSYIVQGLAGPVADPVKFQSVEAWLGVRAFY